MLNFDLHAKDLHAKDLHAKLCFSVELRVFTSNIFSKVQPILLLIAHTLHATIQTALETIKKPLQCTMLEKVSV